MKYLIFILLIIISAVSFSQVVTKIDTQICNGGLGLSDPPSLVGVHLSNCFHKKQIDAAYRAQTWENDYQQKQQDTVKPILKAQTCKLGTGKTKLKQIVNGMHIVNCIHNKELEILYSTEFYRNEYQEKVRELQQRTLQEAANNAMAQQQSKEIRIIDTSFEKYTVAPDTAATHLPILKNYPAPAKAKAKSKTKSISKKTHVHIWVAEKMELRRSDGENIVCIKCFKKSSTPGNLVEY